MPFLINRAIVSEVIFREQLKVACFDHVLETFDLEYNRNNGLVEIHGLKFTPSSFLKSNYPTLYTDHLNIYLDVYFNEALMTINSKGSVLIKNIFFQITEEIEPIRDL